MTWTKYYTYTPDASLAGAADSIDFTVLVKVTHADLKSVANGGLVTENAGAGIPDISFFSDTALTTALKFSRKLWNAATGEIRAWVKEPTLSHTAGIPIYLAYGNAAIVADPQDRVNAWDAGTAAVYLWGDGTTLDLIDEKGSFDLTNNGGTLDTTSTIGAGIAFNGSTQYAERTSSTPATTFPVTLEQRFKPAASVGSTQISIGLNISGAGGAGNLGFEFDERATDVIRFLCGAPTTPQGNLNSATWNYAMGVGTTTTNRDLYLNGAAAINSTTSGTPFTPDNICVGARHNNSSVANFFNGVVGFTRVSTVARSASWATATNNMLNNPATFLVESGPTTVGAAATSRPVFSSSRPRFSTPRRRFL